MKIQYTKIVAYALSTNRMALALMTLFVEDGDHAKETAVWGSRNVDKQ